MEELQKLKKNTISLLEFQKKCELLSQKSKKFILSSDNNPINHTYFNIVFTSIKILFNPNTIIFYGSESYLQLDNIAQIIYRHSAIGIIIEIVILDSFNKKHLRTYTFLVQS